MKKDTSAKAQRTTKLKKVEKNTSKKTLNIVHLTNGKHSLLDENWVPVSMTTSVRNPARTDQYDKEERERRIAFEKAHPELDCISMFMEFDKQERKMKTYQPTMVVTSKVKF